MYSGIPFPDIDPIALQIGFWGIRWYSLAYIFGLIGAWGLARVMSQRSHSTFTVLKIDDFLVWATAGIILGGRLGYVLFYNLGYFLEFPLKILALWEGGMSFHGGALGAVLGLLYMSYSRKVSFWLLTDLAALFAPIGIFLGRLANFVNDELWGRVTDVPWAVRFPSGGYLPRHPSQLYEAFAEGIVIFIVLNLLWRYPAVRRRQGVVSSLFVILYGFFRIVLEFFRQPDAQLGFFFNWLTMGQLLSLPVLLFGICLLWHFAAKPVK